MRFQVPQFIDVEDKIFGPFTFRQFIYIGGGIGASFVLLKFLPKILAIILIIPTLLLAVALAFFKINGQPFISVMESGFKFMFANRLYVWRKKEGKPKNVELNTAEDYKKILAPTSGSRLKDLNALLDTQTNEKSE